MKAWRFSGTDSDLWNSRNCRPRTQIAIHASTLAVSMRRQNYPNFEEQPLPP